MDAMLPQFVDGGRFPAVFTTDQLLDQCEMQFVRRTFEEGACIFMAEEKHRYTYHVVRGLVRLFLTSREGTVKTLFYHAEGTQFGFQGFKRDGLTRSTAVAATSCEVLAIDFEDLLSFCNRNTEYYLAYIEYLFAIMNSQTEEIASLAFQTGVRRLAELLYALAKSEGSVIPYSIDELAGIIGAHRNTVSNSLAHLRKQGLVTSGSRPIAVTDVERLRCYLDKG